MLDRFKKGQSAMEYLMTYGWALLVIVIVIAVLMFIRPFGAPDTCLFQQAGFTCANQRIAPAGVYAVITNGNSKTIAVTGVACAQGANAPVYITAAGNVGYGATITLGDASGGLACGALTSGQDFSGRIYVKYRFTDDPVAFPDKIAVATITGRVQ